jgi:hypothetical protein
MRNFESYCFLREWFDSGENSRKGVGDCHQGHDHILLGRAWRNASIIYRTYGSYTTALAKMLLNGAFASLSF